jgi:FtsP/CotA-like multicopper oxidase with cupredoxin domain
MYGAFLVMEPGQEWDPERDRLFLLGSLGAAFDPDPAVNGSIEPDPVDLRAGTPYRLRFMHISPDDDKRVQLLDADRPVMWRQIAKDGADLPASLVTDRDADFSIGVGETYDFLWTPPHAGDFTLRIVTTFPVGPPNFIVPGSRSPHTADVSLRVR